MQKWAEAPNTDQFSKLALCAAMIDSHETNSGMSFHWVVRARTDAIYLPVPLGWIEQLDSATLYLASNSGDALWFASRFAFEKAVEARAHPENSGLSVKYFQCGCDVVRTREGAAVVAHTGLFGAARLGSRANATHERVAWARALPARPTFSPGTGRGVSIDKLQILPHKTHLSAHAYTILDKRPWSAGR